MGIGRRAVAEELGVGRGPPPFRRLGILEAIAIGGVLSLASGIGALVWYRRIRARDAVAPGAAVADTVASAVLQSTPPNTNAAFNPPKPNEVLSTRR